MQNLDQQLFLALNFDGGPVWDRIMLTLSGTTMWIPLYAVILWLVWRRSGWRGMLLFLVLMAAAVALADMVAGIFKHNGLLGGLLPDFEPRWRPMFTPSLEGLDITPDSLRTLRWLSPEELAAAGYSGHWTVHVPIEAVSGRYGSVLGPRRDDRCVGALLGTGHPPAVVHVADDMLYTGCLLLADLSGQTLPDGSGLGRSGRCRAGLGGLGTLPAFRTPQQGGPITPSEGGGQHERYRTPETAQRARTRVAQQRGSDKGERIRAERQRVPTKEPRGRGDQEITENLPE